VACVDCIPVARRAPVDDHASTVHVRPWIAFRLFRNQLAQALCLESFAGTSIHLDTHSRAERTQRTARCGMPRNPAPLPCSAAAHRHLKRATIKWTLSLQNSSPISRPGPNRRSARP
jgi:hypothetical protein